MLFRFPLDDKQEDKGQNAVAKSHATYDEHIRHDIVKSEVLLGQNEVACSSPGVRVLFSRSHPAAAKSTIIELADGIRWWKRTVIFIVLEFGHSQRGISILIHRSVTDDLDVELKSDRIHQKPC